MSTTSRSTGKPLSSAPTDARVAAAEIAADVRGGALLDVAFDRRVQRLEPRDRRWVQELLYGMMRRRAMIDAQLDQCVRGGGGIAKLERDLVDLLRQGTYQLLHMDSVPDYAAISQAVELVKRRHGIGTSRLANAVLRRIDREHAALGERALAACPDPIDRMALESSHPRWMVARWIARWGEAETRQLLEENNQEAPLVVRPFGVERDELTASLEASGVETSQVQLVPESVQLRRGPAVVELGAFQRGHLLVQDPAATLVVEYADIPPRCLVIDSCAAPGGKTIELSRAAATVVAMDRSPARLRRLEENLRRLDVRNVRVVVADAREAPFGACADAVLVDAPCTGTGTIRRHPDARWRLKVSDLAVAAGGQRQILRAAAEMVRPGGLLIYATCSLEPEENDTQVEQFLREHDGWRLEPPSETAVPATVLDAGRLRVLPHRHHVDGAFAARLRRPVSP
jgi:16S rRNA (cytosine967-C5)-methyltransferase